MLLKNSSRNSTGQFTNDAVLGITAATCCIICVVLLIALSVCAKCYSRSTVCGTIVKRLVVGLIISTMLYQFVIALHLVRYFYPEIKQVKDLCKIEGFLSNYLISVHLLLILDVCLVLFLEILKVTTSCKLECYEKVKTSTSTCCKKINKLEIAIYTSAFTFPLLFDWIPFTTNSYGSSEADVCWFRDQNCSQHTSCTAALWEEVWLFTVPVGFVGILMMLLFTVLLCLLICNIKNARTDRRTLIELAVTNCIFFIAFFIGFFINIIFITLSFALHHSSPTVAQFTLLLIPIAPMLIPLTLLLAIHLPFSSMIARICPKHPQHSHMYGECDRTTVHRSTNWHQPSHTTWNPPHSFNEASENTPFVRDIQRDYRNSGRDIN